ncbi:MAG: ATP-binding cassette domain-containing protein [Actinomycetota bacterium]
MTHVTHDSSPAPGVDNGPSPPEPLLAVRQLVKRFTLHAVDGRTVVGLDGVDLDVGHREHVALAGLSGAGKSSLLKCVHRTYVAESGSIRYRTETGSMVDLLALPDGELADLREREIGYVSQFLRAEPRRGVLDVVARAAQRMGADEEEARDRAAQVLRQLNIGESLWATYPTLLSGGEKQRVNLAAGIVVAPRLLLLDEPVSALDPANRQAVLDVIAELTARGATVLSVFHDLDAMAQLADRIVVLIDGHIIDDGPAADILERGVALVAN